MSLHFTLHYLVGLDLWQQKHSRRKKEQEGSLCAQHCLNNLLQVEYFSPVELSSIVHQLDEEERMRMAEGGVTSEDYHTFL